MMHLDANRKLSTAWLAKNASVIAIEEVGMRSEALVEFFGYTAYY